MGFIESLFSGVRVFVRELVTVVAEAVRVVLEEIDRSSFGRAATQFVEGATRKYFSNALNLVAEERELAEKFVRDGRRSETDAERLQEIATERETLRKQIDAAKASNAAQEFRENRDQVVAVAPSDDEASATVGIIASKTCPECGETMRIRQGGFNDKTERRRFYWQCTSTKFSCPSIKLDPAKGGAMSLGNKIQILISVLMIVVQSGNVRTFWLKRQAVCVTRWVRTTVRLSVPLIYC